MDQANLRALLANVVTPDTNKVKEATAKLKKDYYTSPQSLLLLLQILVSDDTVEIRQLAATEARKLVLKHWSKLQDAQKQEIRTHLLQATMSEQSKLLRHSLSRLIAVIAQVDIEKGQWADLPQLLLSAAESNNPQAREVSTFILFSILDELNTDATGLDYRKIFSVFSKTIQDRENPEVAVNTLYALSKMAVSLDTDGEESVVVAFQGMVPGMVKVLLDSVDSDDATQISRCFEAFQTILESAPKVLDSHFRDLVMQIARLAADTEKDSGVRTQSINFLISALLNRKMKFQALRIGEQLVDLLFKVLAGQEELVDLDDDDEVDLTKSAMHMLALMADQLPAQQIAGPVVTLFKQYAASQDTRQKQAAITALAQVVEGTPDFISTQLPQLIPAILNMLNDPSDSVRESAILGCRDISEVMPEVMAEQHEEFLTAFVKNLSAAVQVKDPAKLKRNQTIAANCCLCIDGLVSGLDKKDVEKYMPELVPNLTHFFTHSDIDVQKASISAIGSIAVVAEKAFLPYFDQSAAALSQFIDLKDSADELELRSISVDILGSMAEAVGPEKFQPYVPGLIRSSQEALNLDHPRLKETSFMLWSHLAKAYGDKFQDFLAPAVTALLESLSQDDNADLTVDFGSDDELPQELSIGGKKVKLANNELGGKADADDDDDDEDDDAWADLAGISALAEEKEVALEALGDIFSHAGKAYMPYYEKTLETVLPLLEHDWDPTRRAAIGTTFRLYASLWKLQPEEQADWQPGLPIKNQPSHEIGKIRDVIMTFVAKQYAEEEDPYCLMEMNQSLAETLRTCGPFLISGSGAVQGIVQVLVSVISKKHPCQVLDQDDEDEILEEHSEDEWSIIGSALDTIAGLAKALGESFGEIFKIFQKLILGHASATAAAERSHTVGALADIIKGMKSGVTPYTTQLLKNILHRLGDEDGNVKSNAAYAIGILVQNSESEAEIKKAYPSILGKLEPLLHTSENRQLDNAAGCVARMITRYPDDLPLDDILPALVKLLPLKEDYEENVAVWPMIVYLYRAGNSTVQELTPEIVPALEKVLGEPEEQLEDETRELLGQLVGYLSSKQPALLQQYPGLSSAL